MTIAAPGLKKLAADFRRADLTPELQHEMGIAAHPLQAGVQKHVLAIPTHGLKHTGLRFAIAHATRTTVTTGRREVRLRVEVDPSAMPPGQKFHRLTLSRCWPTSAPGA